MATDKIDVQNYDQTLMLYVTSERVGILRVLNEQCRPRNSP